MPYSRKQATVPLVSAANLNISPFSELLNMDLDTLRRMFQRSEGIYEEVISNNVRGSTSKWLLANFDLHRCERREC